MKIITSVEEGDLNVFKKQYISPSDLRTEINKLQEEKISKRNKKAYTQWKEKLNFLIDLYNIKVGYSYYKKVE